MARSCWTKAALAALVFQLALPQAAAPQDMLRYLEDRKSVV